MEGMNVVFHVGSALAAVALGWALLKARARMNFVLRLLRATAGGAKSVEVAPPLAWLAQFAAAFEIPFENTVGYDLSPRRIQGWVLAEVFLRGTVTLIRCASANQSAKSGGNADRTASESRAASVTLVLGTKVQAPEALALGGKVAAALGAGVSVQIECA